VLTRIALVDDRVARLTTVAAAVVAALVAVALPLGFYQLGYQRHAGAVEAEVAYHGYVVSQRVSHNPQLWMFEPHRLEELLTKPVAAGEIELRRVLDAAGQVIAEYETAAGRPRSPVLARSIALYDSGRPVGTVVIRRSLRPLLEETIGVALVTSILAGGLFLGLRTVPLRALRRALERVAYLASHDPLTPACPTARCSTSASRGRSMANAPRTGRRRSCASTSIASRTSTTRSGTPPAICCCGR